MSSPEVSIFLLLGRRLWVEANQPAGSPNSKQAQKTEEVTMARLVSGIKSVLVNASLRYSRPFVTCEVISQQSFSPRTGSLS